MLDFLIEIGWKSAALCILSLVLCALMRSRSAADKAIVLRSAVVLPTVAVLAKAPSTALGRTTTSRTTETPLATSPRLHDTTRAATEQSAADTKSTPAGSSSRTLTARARSGPAFWTRSVYVNS